LVVSFLKLYIDCKTLFLVKTKLSI